MFAAVLGGSSAYGGSSESAAPSPIKLGVLTPLTGPFAPWGIQVRAGAALAVNEINRSGGVKGRGGGAADQSRRRGRPVHEHERGHRRLPTPDPAGGSRLGRGHHRQSDRAGNLAARRGGEDPVVPRQGGEQRDPDAVESLHIPYLPALCGHGCPVGRAVRAAPGDHERWRDDRRLRVGPVVQVFARGCGQVRAERQVQRPGCAGSDDQLHAVSACVRPRVVDRCDGPSAGSAAGPGSVGTAGLEGAGDRCGWAMVANGEERRLGGVRPLQRLQVHGLG